MKKRSFGNLRRLESGRWQARYTGPDGRVHRGPRTWQAKDDAIGWLRKEQRLIEFDVWTPPADRDLTSQGQSIAVAAYAARWIDQRDLKPTTRSLYRSYLRQHLAGTELGEMMIGAVTLVDVRDWWAQLREKKGHTDGATRNARVYAWLRTVFESVVDDGLLDANPCRIRGAGQSKRQRAIVVPTPAEVDQLADQMPDRLALLVQLGAWCAMRRGELLGLRRMDVAEDGSGLIVRQAVSFVDGEAVIGTTKNQKQRTVAVPPHLWPAVVDHLDAHTGGQPWSLLFASKVKGARNQPMDEWTLRHYWQEARSALGLEHLRLHDLRHAGSVWAATAGATVPELQRRLGHESTAAALRYMHAASGSDRTIAERLSNLHESP